MFRANLDSTNRSFSPGIAKRSQNPQPTQTVFVAATGNDDPPLPAFMSERRQMMVQEMRILATKFAE